MNLICLDFETYFDDSYSLSKMTTEAYVRDSRFEALGCAIRFEHPTLKQKTFWYPNEQAVYEAKSETELGLAFKDINWRETAVIAHHAHFDGLILSHVYGVKPAFWFDTLSMARMIHGNSLSVSLASLAKHYRLEAKNVPYDLFRGKHWDELTPEEQRLVADGACHDVDLTWTIFQELMKSFPREELPIVDQTVRWFTEPKLVGDQQLFEKIRDEEALSKNERLYALGVGESDLQSAAKFVALLEEEGVEVEYKTGKNDNQIPAIAKTDNFMRELEGHANPRVAALAAARLDVRSTLNETRSGRLAGKSARGPLPVYLAYCAAHTTRWGGGDKDNLQNLPRGSDLRRGLRAPRGYVFISPDQSQGEARVINWLAGQEDVVERFRQGHDPYIPIASKFYGFEVTREHPKERGTGKQLELSCGYGAGGPTIKATAARGTYGPPVYLTDEDADRAKRLYRDEHRRVTAMWNHASVYLRYLAEGEPFSWGPSDVLEGRNGKLYLPNGAWIDYTSLKFEDEEWRLHRRSGWSKIYGAKLVENVVQALSRVVTSQCILRLRAAGVQTVGMSHDDVWIIAKESEADQVAKFAIECMSVTPPWAPGLPLASEAKVGETYT